MRRRVIASILVITVIIGGSFLRLWNDRQTIDPSIQGIELLAFIVDQEGISLSEDIILPADQIEEASFVLKDSTRAEVTIPLGILSGTLVLSPSRRVGLDDLKVFPNDSLESFVRTSLVASEEAEEGYDIRKLQMDYPDRLDQESNQVTYSYELFDGSIFMGQVEGYISPMVFIEDGRVTWKLSSAKSHKEVQISTNE